MATLKHCWQLLLMLAFIFPAAQAQSTALIQTYCSPQNTGMYYQGEVDSYTSLGSCNTQCQESYAFAIVQGSTCWCSNYAPGTQVAIASCSDKCLGFPYEYCGSTANSLYGYLALTKNAWGTSYTSQSVATSTALKSSVAIATPAQTTIVLTSERTVVSTQALVSTQVNTVSAIPTTAVLSVTVVQTSTATEKITIIPVASSTDLSNSISTGISILTVSGAVVTQVVTSIASAAPQSSTATFTTAQSKSSGLSSGAAAGVAIGAILGAALVAGMLWFCCCRSQNARNEVDGETGLNRNTSVLSKAGLLRRVSHREVASGGTGVVPRLQTRGLPGISEDPRSAATVASTMSTRSNSRPMFVDNRLNPNAWSPVHHPNHSTSTLGSLRDYRDYSRPLEVRNPDPP